MFNVTRSKFGIKLGANGCHHVTIGDFDTQAEATSFAQGLAALPALAKLMAKYGDNGTGNPLDYMRVRPSPELGLIEISTTPGKGLYLVGGDGTWYAHRESPATSVGPYATTQEALEALHNWVPPTGIAAPDGPNNH